MEVDLTNAFKRFQHEIHHAHSLTDAIALLTDKELRTLLAEAVSGLQKHSEGSNKLAELNQSLQPRGYLKAHTVWTFNGEYLWYVRNDGAVINMQKQNE